MHEYFCRTPPPSHPPLTHLRCGSALVLPGGWLCLVAPGGIKSTQTLGELFPTLLPPTLLTIRLGNPRKLQTMVMAMVIVMIVVIILVKNKKKEKKKTKRKKKNMLMMTTMTTMTMPMIIIIVKVTLFILMPVITGRVHLSPPTQVVLLHPGSSTFVAPSSSYFRQNVHQVQGLPRNPAFH